MNIAACAVWIAQCPEQMRNPLQTELRCLDFVSEGVQELDRLGVVHAARALLRANIQRPNRARSRVPPTTFSSNSRTDATPAGGITERITAVTETAAPIAPAQRWPNLKPAEKIYTNGIKAEITVMSTRIWYAARRFSPICVNNSKMLATTAWLRIET